MTAAQHKLFDMLVQSASESRVQMHETAWILLGALSLIGIVVLSGVWLWILRGGFAAYYGLESPHGRKAVQVFLLHR